MPSDEAAKHKARGPRVFSSLFIARCFSAPTFSSCLFLAFALLSSSLLFFFSSLLTNTKPHFGFFIFVFFFLPLASVEVIVLSLFVLSSRIASSFLSCLDVHANALTSACIPHALHLSYTEFLKKKKGKIREAARLQDRYTRPDENVRVCACMRVPPFFFLPRQYVIKKKKSTYKSKCFASFLVYILLFISLFLTTIIVIFVYSHHLGCYCCLTAIPTRACAPLSCL